MEQGYIIYVCITITERLVSRTSITTSPGNYSPPPPPTTPHPDGNVCATRAKTIVLVGELFMCGFRLWQAAHRVPRWCVCVCVRVSSLIESCQLRRRRDKSARECCRGGWGGRESSIMCPISRPLGSLFSRGGNTTIHHCLLSLSLSLSTPIFLSRLLHSPLFVYPSICVRSIQLFLRRRP